MGLGKRSSERALQRVLGKGANVNEANPLETHDPKVGSLISYEGTTTADGAGDGSTLLDSVLTTKPDFNGNLVIITSGAYAGQGRDINGVTTGGTVTPASAFGGQILSGVTFVIVALRLTPAEVAAIEAKLDHAAHGLAALKVLIDAVQTDATAILLDTGTTLPATLATIAGYIDTEIGTLQTAVTGIQNDLDNATDGLGALKALIDAVEGKLDTQKGATGIFYEQTDTAVNITATNAAETNVLNLSAASTRYIVRSLRLKCADPGANTVTVRLYELVNDGLTEVDSFDIDSTNFATYHSLMDMFGLPHLAGDELKVTVRASAGGPYAVTGQYSHGKTNN